MIKFRCEKELIEYNAALTQMKKDVEALQIQKATEVIWLLSHPALYTAGTSAKAKDYKGHEGIPVFQTNRGGKYTYHGPGQRIAYLMLDLKKRSLDVRAYVQALENLGITVLKKLGITAKRDESGIGLWVKEGSSKSKIASIGVRLSKWVTSHGIAFNLSPNLDHFQGIVPCGIQEYGVTSLEKLGVSLSSEDFDTLFTQCVLEDSYFNS